MQTAAVTVGVPGRVQVLPKCSPDEKVGALCLRNGRFAVVEYSDIDDVNKNKRCVRSRHQHALHVDKRR